MASREEAQSGQMEGNHPRTVSLLDGLCLAGTLRALSPHTVGWSAQSVAVVTTSPHRLSPLPESSERPHPF